MKFIAYLHEGVPTVGSVELGNVSPIAPRDAFFEDLNHWLVQTPNHDSAKPIQSVVALTGRMKSRGKRWQVLR